MTSLAAAVIAATGFLDLITGSANMSVGWTILVSVVAATLAGLPLVLGDRFPPTVALGGCWAFIGVTSLQVAQSDSVIMAANNIVLYPMVSCYLGWFFSRRVARYAVGSAFMLSGAALWISGLTSVITTWANLALASFFCLEAALYLRAKLDRQIETDPLTGALNRTGLASRLRRELDRTIQTGAPLAVAVIDLDGFKSINDRFGHAAGDRTLVSIVTQLDAAATQPDSVARTGGDEFVLLLPDTSSARAKIILDGLQDSSDIAWTYGLAQASPGDSEETVVNRADDDLYRHKRSGDFGVPIDPTS
ncbi:MAG: GGDEF domain-containing protein [Aeromicrobium sp.]